MRLPFAVLLAMSLAACGAAPAPAPAGPRAVAAAQAAGLFGKQPVFAFRSFDGIADAERRLLEASSVTLGEGAGSRTLGGRPLYDWLALHAPKSLANLLNQTAVLAAVEVAPGKPALGYVRRIQALRTNHVYAEVDPELYHAIARQASKRPQDRTPYVGPEDSGLLHGKYDTSFRENRAYTSQQFAFSAKEGFTKLDLDLDEECPTAGDPIAAALHLLRAAKHAALRKLPGEQYGENSEPDGLYRRLIRPAVKPNGKPDKVGRALAPGYALGPGAPARPDPADELSIEREARDEG